jgi:hypothetical protein
MMDIDTMDREQLVAIAKAALALSSKMIETEEIVDMDESRSSFAIEDEWCALTAAFMGCIRGKMAS